MNKMPMTIYNCNFGEFKTDDGNEGVFANVQQLADFTSTDNKAGCFFGKTNVDTSNNFALSKQILMELNAAQAPIDVIATFGNAVSAGKTVMLIKGIEMVKAKHG
ncbi:hypothetical protein [Vibrio mediterranei]|uniref:hypothetical protein n=1 Tax=Vibrio mediterranei TaxID=689 RepID=UPI00148BCE66|nr:hypothetical protein [Vibrio mediterranei]NOI26349.1 hypothetical protein [Vibrio mediterranei]